jgi:hypothetical protein
MDSIFVVVDRFLKMTYYIACQKTMNVSRVAQLYFNKLVCLYGIPRSITSDKDFKFMSNF